MGPSDRKTSLLVKRNSLPASMRPAKYWYGISSLIYCTACRYLCPWFSSFERCATNDEWAGIWPMMIGFLSVYVVLFPSLACSSNIRLLSLFLSISNRLHTWALLPVPDNKVIAHRHDSIAPQQTRESIKMRATLSSRHHRASDVPSSWWNTFDDRLRSWLTSKQKQSIGSSVTESWTPPSSICSFYEFRTRWERRSTEQTDNLLRAHMMNNIRSEVFLYLSNDFHAYRVWWHLDSVSE